MFSIIYDKNCTRKITDSWFINDGMHNFGGFVLVVKAYPAGRLPVK